jgi:hypothetical protein
MTHPLRLRRHARGSQGFTLVELMVALSGGLFLSMMVFALSRDTSRFYQRENRLAGAVLAGMSGFERLKADIARAGYLTTPNIQRDPRVCMRPVLGWPAQLASMSSLRINPDTPAGNAAIAGAGLTPDQIVLAGSYAVTDRFAIASVAGNTIFLQMNRGPMARLGYLNPALGVPGQTALLASVFPPGRVIRTVDDAGLQYFGVVNAVAGGPNPSIVLNGAPPPVAAGGAAGCGINGFATGSYINVVNFVSYQIKDLQADGNARFQPLWAQSAGAPGEATRTELVREELDAAGTDIETLGGATTELVAEYAVDLGFSVTAQLPGANNLVEVQPGNANFPTIFAANPLNIGAPERVRAVRVRLSVRSREADRDAPIPGGLYRFRLPDGAWARVRTFQADVALENQLDVRWPIP